MKYSLFTIVLFTMGHLHAQTNNNYLLRWNQNDYKITQNEDFVEVYRMNNRSLIDTSVKPEKVSALNLLMAIRDSGNKNVILFKYKSIQSDSTFYRILDHHGISNNLDTVLNEGDLYNLSIHRAEKWPQELDDYNILLQAQFPIIETTILKLGESEQELLARTSQKVHSEHIGTFSLINLKPNIYRKADKKDSTEVKLDYVKTNQVADIDKITIRIVEGFIVECIAYTNDQQVFDLGINRSFNLYRISQKISEKYLRNRSKEDSYLSLNQLIKFENGGSFGFKPSDTLITLKADTKTVELTQRYSINSMINARIYTDLRGFIGKATNGIVNVEMSAEFPLNVRNYGRILILPDVTTELRYSKFDQGSNLVMVDSTNTLASSLKLFQGSYLEAGFNFGLLKSIKYTGRYDMRIGLTGAFLLTDLYDSNEESLASDLHSFSLGLQFGNKFSINKRFWCYFDMEYTHLFPISKNVANINDADVLGFNIELSYRSNIHSTSTDGFYMKYGGFYQIGEFEDSFTQIQFGYRVGLDDALSESKK